MNPIESKFTIVTAFYDIRSKEPNHPPHYRKKNKYIEVSSEFMLKLPYPIVFFSDDQEIVSHIQEYRKDQQDKTVIYQDSFESTYFYQYKNQLEDLQKRYTILNSNKEHETPLYIILNNNKFHFIEKAIERNPYQSTHFIWIDFGINHVAKDTHMIHEWICRIPDQIRQLCINPFLENEHNKGFFRYIYHHMAGGLFSGSKENLLEYSRLFKKKVFEIYHQGWYQIDEAIMTMVERENPELFDLYYGDYEGIIANYERMTHSINLIFRMLKKTKEFHAMSKMNHILQYMISYFKMSRNQNSNLFYEYLEFHLINNLHTNDRKLKKDVIELILKKKRENDLIIKMMLEKYRIQILFYENRNEILY